MPHLLLRNVWLSLAVVFLAGLMIPGARAQEAASETESAEATESTAPRAETAADDAPIGPCLVDPTKTPIPADGVVAREATANSDAPREIDPEKEPWLIESVGLPANHPAFSRPKMIWAKSFLWREAPQIEVEKWIGDAPETEGKYILLECWATWCPPCRRSLALLNYYHEKYGEELCVIAINETSERDLQAMKGPVELKDVKFYMGIDTQRRTADALGVFGVPHAVIIEPDSGGVIWEGMPTMPGHELKPEIIEKILEIGRRLKAARAAKAEAAASPDA